MKGIHMYNYILFDLDGTITESGPGIIHSVSYALKKMGLNAQPDEVLQKFIGPPLVYSFVHFGGVASEKTGEAIAFYREYYTQKGIKENSLYQGVEEAFQKLKAKGKTLAVATSKPELFAREILADFHLTDYFDVICGATMDEKRVSKGEIIAVALKELGIDEKKKSQVIMVGDREHDILGAKENGLDSIGVLYGYGSREELEAAGADRIVAKAEDIIEVVSEHPF